MYLKKKIYTYELNQLDMRFHVWYYAFVELAYHTVLANISFICTYKGDLCRKRVAIHVGSIVVRSLCVADSHQLILHTGGFFVVNLSPMIIFHAYILEIGAESM